MYPVFPSQRPKTFRGMARAVCNHRLGTIGIEDNVRYINTGVMVVNLTYWRENCVSEKVFDFARKHGDLLKFHDQDAINAVLKDSIRIVDYRWNVQAIIYDQNRGNPSFTNKVSRLALDDPSILHYTTANKPWSFRSQTPKRHIYYKYRRNIFHRHRSDPPDLGPLMRTELWLDQCFLLCGVNVYRPAGRIGRFLCRRVLAMALLYGGWQFGRRRRGWGPSSLIRPLVFILIPAYSAEPWIAASLAPAVSQDWPRKEVVVVNGSADRTYALASRFASLSAQVSTSRISRRHINFDVVRLKGGIVRCGHRGARKALQLIVRTNDRADVSPS